jgi:hypothetical protein
MAPIDRTTLLSFPSVTDSAPSEWDDESLKANITKESLRLEVKDVEGDKSRDKGRPRTPRKYPRNDDDKDETESLWRKTQSAEDDSDTAVAPEAGVRLVQTKRH